MSSVAKIIGKCQEHEKILLGLIVGLGLVVRLYGVTLPLMESHQIRQAQTAMMARNLHDDNMNVFRTRLDFFGNGSGYVLMEFPIMHGITALLYYLFGVHEIIGRLVSIGFSLGAMGFMYGLARQFLTRAGALAALALYAMSPSNIFFSRAFMPESSMMFFLIAAVYLALKWLDEEKRHIFVWATVCAALACLSKPTAGLIFAPIWTAWYLKHRWHALKRVDFWLYILFALGSFILWGVYANLINATNPDVPAGFGGSWLKIIIGRGNIFKHWISLDFYRFVGGSIILLILTPLGFIGSIIGIIKAKRVTERSILYVWLVAIVAYFYALAGANSGHIYYHLHLLPLAAIFFGIAVEWLLGKTDIIKLALARKSVTWPTLGLLLITIVAYGFGYYKFFAYMYDTELRMPYALEVAEIIKENTPSNRAILLNQPMAMPAVVTYYAQCKTWYFKTDSNEQAIADLEKLRARGATTYVAIDTMYGSGVRDTEEHAVFYEYLKRKYTPISLSEHYLIYDLSGPKS